MSDRIERQAAIDAIKTVFAITSTQQDVKWDCIDVIEHLPSAEPERKTGRWIVHEEGITDILECSECGHLIDFIRMPNFCEECGAKMEVEHDRPDNPI